VKDALKRALEMNPVDRSDRHRRNMEYSLRLTTTAWAMEVLRDLKRVQQSCGIESVGLGAGFRVLGVRAGFHQLDMTALTKTYRICNKRLILLDWGGTLVQEDEKENKLQFYAVAQGHASRSGPSPALTEVLEGLCSDPKNIVFVVSGKEIHAVTEFFGRIRGLNLGAEHGYYYYWADDDAPAIESIHDVQTISRGESKWKTMVELGEHLWKESVKMMMDVYVERTHGTYIEQKGHALIWQFRDADPEFGYLQSKELQDNLAILLANFAGVDVLRGGGVSDGYIEVRPSGISKGLFLEHVMSILKSKEVDVDFVLTVGDDISDEPMFDAVESLLSMKSKKPINAYSVTVGKKSSAARAYVDDPAAVMEMLVMLNKAMKSSVSPRIVSCDLRTSKSELILNTRGVGSRTSSDRLALAVDSRPTLVSKLFDTNR
jgi:trehalose 6-phosphate synthase/phosphatase